MGLRRAILALAPALALGGLRVERSCISCDVCRWMAPGVFKRRGIFTSVEREPNSPAEEELVYAAMVSCPTQSIVTDALDARRLEAVKTSFFPRPVEAKALPEVHLLGYHSLQSDMCTAYLVQRSPEDGGSIMVDCPRFDEALAARIEKEFGGLGLLLITHRDNGRDSAAWKERFPAAQRVVHRLDVMPETRGAEQKLEGVGPWEIPGDSTPRLTIHWAPGHTPGSTCLHVESRTGAKALFSGGTLGYNARRKRFDAFAVKNRAGLDRQVKTLGELRDQVTFEWLLPSHGRSASFVDDDERRDAFDEAIRLFDDEPLKSLLL